MFLQEHLDQLKLGDPSFKLSSFRNCSARNTEADFELLRVGRTGDNRVLSEKFEFGFCQGSKQMFLEEHSGTCFAHGFTACTALRHCFEG
jgi:hypothetical protein